MSGLGRGRTIGVVDAGGVANLGSAERALTRAAAARGDRVVVADRPGALATADALVLPGVGAFEPAARALDDGGWRPFLSARVAAGVPLVGICLGFQLLFDGSDEHAATRPGLGLLGGRVRALAGAPTLPHIAWNTVSQCTGPLMGGRDGEAFYFVHSFAPEPDDPADVWATCRHGHPFAAAAGRGRVGGVQFHPEKSGAAGAAVLDAVVALAGAAETATPGVAA